MGKRLTDIISVAGQTNEENVRFLKETTERYPYCQPAWMLYAKLLMDTGSPAFENAVNRASAIAVDRRHFKAFLKSPKQPEHSEGPTAKSAGLSQTATPERPDSIPNRPERSEGPIKEVQRTGVDHQQQIIEKFLQADPRIEARRDNTPTVELSKQSLEDHPDIISETLADILVQQGKIARASEIYKKLSLIFPEKSRYFAKKLQDVQTRQSLNKQ